MCHLKTSLANRYIVLHHILTQTKISLHHTFIIIVGQYYCWTGNISQFQYLKQFPITDTPLKTQNLFIEGIFVFHPR